MSLFVNMMSGERSPPVEEHDRVVMETPVYLSKLLLKKLHIFQHSVRPKSAPIESPVIRSRIKPVLQEVELEVKMDTQSLNFDGKRATEIANRVDGEDDDKPKVYESGIMDRQVLVSGPYTLEHPLNYAIGKFQDGALHLCPVKAILQLQPSFAHGDLSGHEPEKTYEEKEEVVEEVVPEKISVKFQRHESERTKKLKKMTYSYYMKKRAEEKWIETQYYPANSEESELERRKILCNHPRLAVPGINTKPNEYLRSLIPYKPVESIPTPGSLSMVSVASLRPLTWHDKLRTLLMSAKIIQFGKLVYLLSDERKPKEISFLLNVLQSLAVMIRGNWIVKSEVMYPEGTKSRHHGVPATVMCRARDYLLTMFNQQKYVGQVKFVNFVKIPREEAKEMLLEISMYHENKGWDLLYPTDNEFMRRYTELTVSQQRMLEEKRNILDATFKEIHEPSKSPEAPRRQRKKSGREGSGAANDSGSDTAVPARRRKKMTHNSGNI